MKKGLCDLYDFINVLVSWQFEVFDDGSVAFSCPLCTAFPCDVLLLGPWKLCVHSYAGLGALDQICQFRLQETLEALSL